MDEIVKAGDEVFMRSDGRRETVASLPKYGSPYVFNSKLSAYRYEFIPAKWRDDKVGNTGIGVCAKNGSEG